MAQHSILVTLQTSCRTELFSKLKYGLPPAATPSATNSM